MLIKCDGGGIERCIESSKVVMICLPFSKDGPLEIWLMGMSESVDVDKTNKDGEDVLGLFEKALMGPSGDVSIM